MTSEVGDKTNEFLRRRKLRIQQVREQSKHIAKKIRQRTNVEKHKHLVSLDAEKEKEYLEQQDKLVKKLQQLYVKGLDRVGTSHRSAAEVVVQEVKNNKSDLTKERGRAAAAELRRQKQVKLDQKKKLLDRKLLAREAANEISREKSSSAALRNLEPPVSQSSDEKNLHTDKQTEPLDNCSDEKDKPEITRSEMATQWNYEELPNEWVPHVPQPSLPKVDSSKDSPKSAASKTEKIRKPNLFAISDEMPTSLRGGFSRDPEETASMKPSLTLVSDYIQNRDLRLRDYSPSVSKKDPIDDLQSIKQTILRTRASRTEGIPNNVCHVADIQVVPVPSWEAQTKCGVCSQNRESRKNILDNRESKKATDSKLNVTNSRINAILSSIRPVEHDILPSPVLRGVSPFKRSKVSPKTFSARGSSNLEKPSKITANDVPLSKKNSITMYNHSTRDTREVPYGSKKLVIRDEITDEDAYSQAVKKNSIDVIYKEKEHGKKMHDVRTKVAVSKQQVEKEYQDTMAFLNSMPKDKSKPLRHAYKDAYQQQAHKECRQRKMQQEFKKIQRESQKQSHVSFGRCESRFTAKDDSDDEFLDKEMKYSWMPVPESDGNLAVHNIPNTLKEPRSTNGVRFEKIDSYHEYRSRHKHTPPTKDVPDDDEEKIDTAAAEDGYESSTSTDPDSIVNLSINSESRRKSRPSRSDISDSERIIIYKVLDSKADKKAEKLKRNTKLLKNIVRSLNFIDKGQSLSEEMHPDEIRVDPLKEKTESTHTRSKSEANKASFECIQEGIYKTVNDKGRTDLPPRISYKVMSCYTTHVDSPFLRPSAVSQRPWWDNVNMYQPDEVSKKTEISSNKVENSTSNFNRNVSFGSIKHPLKTNATQAALPSVQTSNSSFQTAFNDKTTSYPLHDKATGSDPSAKLESEGGCIKIIDDKGEESGKFYIGATGFLSDDAYELIIQLRKKEDSKVSKSVVLKKADIESRSSTAKKLITEITEEALKQNIPCDESKTGESLPETNTQNIQETTTDANREGVESENPKSEKQKSEKPKSETPNSEKPNSEEPGKTKELKTKDLKSEESKFIEKGVSMTCVESIRMKRSETPLKPAHTVCTQTQTSVSSPERPAYNRLSSSTSTAYLSPPELIMPSYMKRPYQQMEPSFMRDSRTKPVQSHKINEKKASKIAKQFTLLKKYVLAQPKVPIVKQFAKVLKAPPNSVRTCSSVCIHEGQGCKKKRKIRNTKHCSKNQKGKLCGKQKSKIKLNRSPISKNKTKSVKTSNSELNPVVKHYVDKLLEISKDGRLVVDVFKQDCSEVTTPGSSIVDVPHNVIGDNSNVDPKISIQQIKNMLIKQILLECQKSTVPVPIIPKNIRSVKKKTVHKVKSLKISRDLSSNKPNRREFSSSDDHQEDIHQDIIRSISIQPRKLKKTRSKSSPSPRNNYRNVSFKSISSDFLYNMQGQKRDPTQDSSRPDTGSRSVNSETPYTAKCIPPHLKIIQNIGPNIEVWKNPKLDTPREIDRGIAGQQKNSQIQSPKSQEPVLEGGEQMKDEITFWSHIRSRILKEQAQNINVMLPDYSSQKQNLPSLRPIPRTPENLPQQNDRSPRPQNISIKLQGQYENSPKQHARTPEHTSLVQEKPLKTSNQSPVTPLQQESKISKFEQDSLMSSNSITSIQKSSQMCGTQDDLRYVPLTISTQTCDREEMTFLKLAEDKLQNMEKIADLTEQCTQRLSNLAKVLDEVRKNKLPIGRLSDSGSELDSPRASVDTSYTQVVTPVHDTENKRDKSKSPLNPEDLERDLLDRSSSSQSKANKSKSPKAAICSKLSSSQKRTPKSAKELRAHSPSSSSTDSVKSREKRSPALTRRCLKRATDFIAPHELSTVIEVDSPLSLNYKNKCEDVQYQHGSDTEDKRSGSFRKEGKRNNPDLLPSSENVASNKNSTSDSSDEFKLQMMDLKQFNEIMLKPFISIQDYAKQCKLETLEEGSNVEISKLPRDDAINDDISSLHSDGSLPDVIAELLKRKIINEPFKYDTVNSSTVTSESTMSILALSKVKKDRRKTKTTFSNKENIGESSDTLSFSTNPDLENAFQKLGMGWASSTLKKTKERLALSSSSNSSSSSVVPYKKHGFPVLATDSSTTQNASHTTIRVRPNEPHTQVRPREPHSPARSSKPHSPARSSKPHSPTRSSEPRHQVCPSETHSQVRPVEVHSQVRPSEAPSQVRPSEAHSQVRPSGPYMQIPTISPIGRPATECTKSAGLQTSLTNSMTVQQFLTRELAKKITFTHKSHSYSEDLEDEFVSLYDTKIPEALQASPKLKRADRSMDSNARARTSTPVQIYKSITYHTSSSSNMSNGLFSNADLSSVKQTSHSLKNHSTSDDKDDLTIPNFSLRTKKGLSECSKSD